MMAILGWLKFRGISNFVFFALLIIRYIGILYMRILKYLSNRVRIRATRQSRKYELIKLPVPFFSSMYADYDFTVSSPKYAYWNSITDDLWTILYFVSFKCRLYSHVLSL